MEKVNILIHGFNVKDPEKTVGRLRPFVKDALMFNYGYLNLFGVLFKNKAKAKDLAGFIHGKESTIYAHSNGNAISVIAARKYGAEIENLICIAPALNRNLVFPDSIKNILVLSTKKDKATKSARFFDSIPVIGWFVPNIWGSMGTDNYTGTDKRVTKLYLGDIISGHSDYFSDENTEIVSGLINDWLVKENRKG